jgi:hypothetical protein
MPWVPSKIHCRSARFPSSLVLLIGLSIGLGAGLVTAFGLRATFFDASPSADSNPEAVYWRKVEKIAAEQAAKAERGAEGSLKKVAPKDEDKASNR